MTLTCWPLLNSFGRTSTVSLDSVSVSSSLREKYNWKQEDDVEVVDRDNEDEDDGGEM